MSTRHFIAILSALTLSVALGVACSTPADAASGKHKTKTHKVRVENPPTTNPPTTQTQVRSHSDTAAGGGY